MSWWYGLTSFLTRSLGTLAVWQWALLLAIPPLIVLLYFLKLKRQPLEVPSTYLWHKTIEDLHVNSLWQRLRQNLLLLLQLLLLLLAILACIDFSWRSSLLRESRYIFLIDTSGSMSATDADPTRLAEAKSQVIDRIDQLSSSSKAMVISFSDRAIVEQPFTSNKKLLRTRVAAIQPTQRPSDVDEALRVAAGLANPGRSATEATDVAAPDALPATLVVFSDGRFRTVPRFNMGNLSPVYVSIGSQDAANIGISAFSSGVSPEYPDRLQLFVQLHNFGPEDHQATLDLYLRNPNENLLDSDALDIPAGGERGVEFTIDAIQDGELRLVVRPEGGDAFELDNIGHIALNPRRRSRVLLVTPDNDALQTVLETPFMQKLADVRTVGPDFLVEDAYQTAVERGEFDLIMFDQCQPETMPACNTYFIGGSPPGDDWSVDVPAQLPQIIDSDPAHPVMRYVEMGDVMWIVDAAPVQPPAGGTVLLDSHLGPLIAIGPRAGYEDLVQAFPIVDRDDESGERYANTDWPIRVSFPVFMGNVISYLGGASAEAEQLVAQPGQAVTLRLDAPVDQIDIETPSGQRLKVPRSGNNTFLFSRTETTGVYQVRLPGRDDVVQRFAVNLFDAVESNLAPDDVFRTEYEDIEKSSVVTNERQEVWKYFLILGLVVLIFEWYVYNRRVYI